MPNVPYLVVVALDGHEDLPQPPGRDDVVLELHREPPAELDHLDGRLGRLGECGVEEAETEAVLQVAHGVHEGGVALADDVVEGVLGLVVAEAVGSLQVALVVGLLQLAEEYLQKTRLSMKVEV